MKNKQILVATVLVGDIRNVIVGVEERIRFLCFPLGSFQIFSLSLCVCVCVCVSERERARESERERERARESKGKSKSKGKSLGKSKFSHQCSLTPDCYSNRSFIYNGQIGEWLMEDLKYNIHIFS